MNDNFQTTIVLDPGKQISLDKKIRSGTKFFKTSDKLLALLSPDSAKEESCRRDYKIESQLL